MLAVQPTMDHTPHRPAIGTSDQLQPGHGATIGAGAEGIIYCTPDGDGYILYATTQPKGA